MPYNRQFMLLFRCFGRDVGIKSRSRQPIISWKGGDRGEWREAFKYPVTGFHGNKVDSGIVHHTHKVT